MSPNYHLNEATRIKKFQRGAFIDIILDMQISISTLFFEYLIKNISQSLFILFCFTFKLRFTMNCVTDGIVLPNLEFCV